MSGSEQSNSSEFEIVTVSKHGQATIPKRFREKLGIGAPGRVRFRETEGGEVVVEQVPSAQEMLGFAASREARTDTPATQLLQEKRGQDRAERDERFSEDE